MTTYLRNSAGTVNSFNDVDVPGVLALHPTWTVVDPVTAKTANPQVFGKADPAVLQTWRPSTRDAVGNVYVPAGDPTTAPNYPQSPAFTG